MLAQSIKFWQNFLYFLFLDVLIFLTFIVFIFFGIILSILLIYFFIFDEKIREEIIEVLDSISVDKEKELSFSIKTT